MCSYVLRLGLLEYTLEKQLKPVGSNDQLKVATISATNYGTNSASIWRHSIISIESVDSISRDERDSP